MLVIKRYRRNESAEDCVKCADDGRRGAWCPGHRYAVLPGGHVEADESAEEAAVRELREEATLEARIDRLLWRGHHHGRPAGYYLMRDVRGSAELSGPEAHKHGPDNSYELVWAPVDAFRELNLYPPDIREPLSRLLTE